MPPRSEKQRRAMHAAAAGRSTLGIPASVGEDFSSADPGGKLPEEAPSAPAPPSHGPAQKRSGSLSAKALFSRKGK